MSTKLSSRILEVTSYPPPRAGWGIRVEFLKKRLEALGHTCVVLNIGQSRRIPSPEYETVLSGIDFVRKVWRFSRRGFRVHAHANGDSTTGGLLALLAQLISLISGRRPVLTFHAGTIQRFFPRDRQPWMVPLFWMLFTIPRRIICNSEEVKRCIAGYGISSAKIAAIPAFSRQYLEFTRIELPPAVSEFVERHPALVFTYLRMRTLFYPNIMIEGMAAVLRERADAGLVICGGTGHSDSGVQSAFEEAIRRHGIANRICFIDDLDHDAFLSMLLRSSLYLRTPITDGVASSVLEALALGVPVVACDNGTRPAPVVKYECENPVSLAAAVNHVLTHREKVVKSMEAFDVSDTIDDEVAVLTA